MLPFFIGFIVGVALSLVGVFIYLSHLLAAVDDMPVTHDENSYS